MTIKELEQKKTELEDFLSKAKGRRDDWSRKLRERKQSFEKALVDDTGVQRINNRIQAAERAVETWDAKVSDAQEQLKRVRAELLEARYPESREKARGVEQEAREEIARQEQRLLDAIKDTYQEAWRAQSKGNSAVSEHNRLAAKVGAQKLYRISRMGGLSADSWARGIIRAAIREGDL